MVFQAHPGDILAGKYRVDKVLGIGGMGMVVAATHLELDQQVALKFMLGELATSPNLLDRFLREARAVAKLRGEHVCRIFDVGRLDNGSPYIVMELLQGEDFAAVLSREGTLAPSVAVGYLLQAIEGVAEAHAEGIVHRDLKPGNLFITNDRDGTLLVKVLDFGISKSASAPATKTGDIMGSPGYMAPEQMSNAKATDARTDVWALGVILYQALSGRMPWTGDSLPALCMSVISDPAPPLPASVPAGLQAVVERCLVKEKEGRWPNVGELARELAKFGDAEAAQTATRITKIVSSTIPAVTPSPSTGVPPTIASGDTRLVAGAPVHGEAAPSATEPDRASDRPTVAARPARDEQPSTPPIRPVSTFSSSAAELKVPPVEPPVQKSKKPLVAAAGALVAGGLALAVGLGRGGDDAKREVVATTPSAPTPAPVVEEPLAIGKRTASKKGCTACHTTGTKHGTGPSFAGAWGTTIELANGDRIVYDEAYVRESIMVPNIKLRRGFTPAHPSYEGQLTDGELGGLVAYIQSLATEAPPPPETIATPTPPPVTPQPPTTTTRPATTRPTTTARPTTTKPAETKPAEPKKPDELWMHMTHDKDKK